MKNAIIRTIYITVFIKFLILTYFFFLKLLLIIFVLLDSFYHYNARPVDKTLESVDGGNGNGRI